MNSTTVVNLYQAVPVEFLNLHIENGLIMRGKTL